VKEKKIEKYNYINCSTKTFPFNVPAIPIANKSTHVTPVSVSLSSSQQLCTFCCLGQYKLNTQEQSPCVSKI